MKTLNVVSAIICDGDKIMLGERIKGDLKGLWEFPGGKIEENETKEDAIIREIREELNVTLKIKDCVGTIEYDYPQFHLVMTNFLGYINDQNIALNDHKAICWVDPENPGVELCPADKLVLKQFLDYKNH